MEWYKVHGFQESIRKPQEKENAMRILNASDPKGALFNKQGTELLHPEWPEDGHLKCPHICDQELFKVLENASWADGRTIASVRWWVRKSDELEKGPAFVKGTFGFHGSGIHFYFCDSRELTRDNLHFVCEVPWKSIFEKIGENEYDFIGAELLRYEFLAQVVEAAKNNKANIKNLDEQLAAAKAHSHRLKVYTRDLD